MIGNGFARRLGRAGILAAFAALGCGAPAEERTLPIVQLALHSEVAPAYDDGETQLFEARRSVPIPVLAPSSAELAALSNGAVAPFERAPWVTLDDIRVQLSFTLTNLDDRTHVIEVLIDPWNEFARYYPGLMVADDDGAIPNLSGIHARLRLEGKGAGPASRVHGVFTFDDMDELARDLATVMNMVANPPSGLSGADEEEDPLLVYVNHTFANHSTRDVLAVGYIPPVIPALTGFDLGLRSTEPATVAIEVATEVVDLGSGKLQQQGDDAPVLLPPETVITVGVVAP
ncbi:MAG: hypothetical protein DIU78_000805 [Pseudomonadota bacterium]|nr:MAG: hypothetical protein DIU78_02500 [Pseudomonadota bacterium]